MLETGREIEGGFVERADFMRTAARKSIKRGIRGTRRLRIDEIENGLCLIVIKSSVEKGALGEFAASRKPGTRRKTGLENTARRNHPAMALELDDVLARVTVGRLEEENNGFIKKSFRFRV